MTTHLIITDAMLPVPNDIAKVKCYGDAVITDAKNKYIESGLHMMLEGDTLSFINWLKEFTDGVWVGQDDPILKRFKLRTVIS